MKLVGQVRAVPMERRWLMLRSHYPQPAPPELPSGIYGAVNDALTPVFYLENQIFVFGGCILYRTDAVMPIDARWLHFDEWKYQ